MPYGPGTTFYVNKTVIGSDTYCIGNSCSTSSPPMIVSVDYRPTYLKGTMTIVAGSRRWITPTAYTRASRRVNQSGSAYYAVTLSGQRYTHTRTVLPIHDFITNDGKYSAIGLSPAQKYNVTSAAKVEALNEIADQKANIGETLATYLQTVRMFKSKTSLLYDILNAAKKGKLKPYLTRSVQDLLKNGDKKAAQAYLEYVYGWKPLVSDVFGLYELLREYSSGERPVIVKGHGSQTQRTTRQFIKPDSQSPRGWLASCTVDEKYRGTCDIYGRVDPDLIAFRMINQLGLLNPVSLAWDLTPWSFVADWLLPIGPVLQAFTAPIGLHFISGTVATRCSRSFEGVYHTRVGSGGANIIDRGAAFTVQDELYDREVLSNWPIPTPYLNLNPLSGDRSYKALALAIMQLRR